ncbi:MAG: hypothetical protein ABID87_08480 [Chloroflexota bacterium]
MEDSTQYEVLNPWAEVDPVPPRGIAPRPADLAGKTVGLFAESYKVASVPILKAVEKGLKERFPAAKFSWFIFQQSRRVTETEDKDRFEQWVRSVDTAVTAVGD